MKGMHNKKNLGEWLVTIPPLGWLFIFFMIPTIIAITIAFRPSSPYGDIEAGWTLENFIMLFSPTYITIIWRTIWISFISTIICLFFALPTGYYMARLSQKWRQIILLLIIVPFWTNFLIRIFAWKIILNPEGILQYILISLGIISKNTMMLYRTETVILVTVYTYLPFAILPIFAAAEKFNFKLLEAAQDLGASRWESFSRIFLPNISKGLKVATFMVMIPCLGSYIIPDLVGGTNSEMIGNLIATQAFIARNIPMAAAWATVLMAMILFPMGLVISTKLLSRKMAE